MARNPSPSDPPHPSVPLVDTHAHLADPDFARDMAGVLARARAAGVGRILVIGTTAEDSEQAVAIAREHPGLHASVGIHPNHAAEAVEGDWERVVALAGDPLVVAIGETGLDRYWDKTPCALQQEMFDRHLDLSEELGKPVVIHARESLDDILEQLRRRARPIRGVMHSFTGDRDQAAAFLDLGLYLSFAGMITFKNKGLDPLREAAAAAPADRILVETDCPYLSPEPFRGRPNEPARVAWTARKVAQLRGTTLDELAAQTSANAAQLFQLPA
ncbi:MAG: TatD family hydrolase [Isosphaeraceae bacterium]